jgi:hypothetical protein
MSNVHARETSRVTPAKFLRKPSPQVQDLYFPFFAKIGKELLNSFPLDSPQSPENAMRDTQCQGKYFWNLYRSEVVAERYFLPRSPVRIFVRVAWCVRVNISSVDVSCGKKLGQGVSRRSKSERAKHLRT